MLKKLRLKFILVNMTIVTIMLGIIFCLLYYSASRNLERGSLQMMESLSLGPVVPGPPDISRGNIRLPYFSILIDHDGRTVEAEGNFFDLSNKEQLNSILTLTNEANSERGILKEYKLRFLCSHTPLGTRIVYADITNEQSILLNLIQAFSIVGGVAFLVFLGISILLARWAVKPVARAWQQQKQFVADASHELKTPLTVIQTSAELLHASDCPDADREPLSESILTMSYQMRGLVENLLDLARIDNGSVKEEFIIVSFSDIVSEAAMTFEPVFFEKSLPLHYEIEPDIRVNGIQSHLKQLICILLDNAAKYASPGGQTIIKLSKSSQKKVFLEVSNQGEPINPDDLKHLFERFYRANKARSMNHSYGLGLSIAQSVAQEHHGKIWAASEGGYNHFYVEMPCRE